MASGTQDQIAALKKDIETQQSLSDDQKKLLEKIREEKENQFLENQDLLKENAQLRINNEKCQ